MTPNELQFDKFTSVGSDGTETRKLSYAWVWVGQDKGETGEILMTSFKFSVLTQAGTGESFRCKRISGPGAIRKTFMLGTFFQLESERLLLLPFDWLLIRRQSLGRAEANPHVYAEIKGLWMLHGSRLAVNLRATDDNRSIRRRKILRSFLLVQLSNLCRQKKR